VTATKRERTIAIAAAVALLSYLGYSYVVSPYLDHRKDLQGGIKEAQAKAAQERKLLKEQPKVAAEWKALLATNLRTTPADASSKTWDALFDWARSASLNLQSIKPEHASQQGDFQQVRLQVSGTGSESSIARWLWSIESSNLPLQIDDLHLNTRKDGTDDLTVQVGLTALVFAPPPPKGLGAKARPAPTGDVP
jgi:type II secretory pathway component PulM